MKKAKRIISILLVLVTTFGLLTGCGEKKTANDGPRKLTVGIPQDATIPDYNTNAFVKYLEEKTNIDIEFTYFASGSSNYKQQLTLMCTGGEKLPDVLLGFTGMSHYVVNQFGEDGFIVDLTDLIEEHAVNYKEQLKNLPDDLQTYIKEKGVNTNDGSFYAMPFVTLECIDNLQSLVYINKTWLDKLGLQMPTTKDELYNVCKAFATQDPNGNGEADEMPILNGSDVYNYIINAFIQYDAYNFNVDENGKVWDPVVTDEFRQALIFINKMVSENLYNELSFTLDQKEMKNMISPVKGEPRVGIFGDHHESSTNAATDILDDFVALPALADATGRGGYTIYTKPSVTWSSYITKDCDNPELAMEFLDAFYLDETVSRMRHGEKDVDWVYEEGKNAYGTDSYVKIINSQAYFDGSLNKCTANWLGILTQWNYLAIETKGEGRIAQASRLQTEQWDIVQTGKIPKQSVDRLIYTTEEYELREKKSGNMDDYLTEQMVLFMNGEKNPSDDKAWNEFLDTLDTLGRSELMEVAQNAFNRKSAK